MKLSWALAVSGDLDVDELGNSDDGDTGVQDDAEKLVKISLSVKSWTWTDWYLFIGLSYILLTLRPC